MAASPGNVSFDGSPVQFRMESPLLACFDPLLLDMLGELLPRGEPVNVARLLEDANANLPALACFEVPDFQPGLYSLDPHDIKKFGDDDADFDFAKDDVATDDAVGTATYPFVSVDSSALIFADVQQLPKLVGMLTWEQYDLGFQIDSVFDEITKSMGGPFFAIILGGSLPGMEFDGDGTYTLEVKRLKPCHA
jgi:hypothetical protein